MPDPSPATQAILDAYNDELNGEELRPSERRALAAAFTALAVRIKGADGIRQDVLDIVNELERL